MPIQAAIVTVDSMQASLLANVISETAISGPSARALDARSSIKK